MSEINRKLEREWDHWATVEELSEKFDISKRRVQQIIAANQEVVEKAILVRGKYYGSALWEMFSTPIYRLEGTLK